jgi:hypothetical protein
MSFNVALYGDLFPHLGMAQISLWFCPACYPDTLASSLSTSPLYLWAVILSCSGCGLQWLVCKECSKNRKHLCSPMDILHHHCSKHCETLLFSVQCMLLLAHLLLPVELLWLLLIKTCHHVHYQKVNGVRHLHVMILRYCKILHTRLLAPIASPSALLPLLLFPGFHVV